MVSGAPRYGAKSSAASGSWRLRWLLLPHLLPRYESRDTSLAGRGKSSADTALNALARGARGRALRNNDIASTRASSAHASETARGTHQRVPSGPTACPSNQRCRASGQPPSAVHAQGDTVGSGTVTLIPCIWRFGHGPTTPPAISVSINIDGEIASAPFLS